ncbi:MAG: hypothetical protein VXW00_12800 [Candidatus Latescibacterota bacterium]|nr:hypothetical protein [Candidatus Latescibacterota bacterium]
MEPVHVEQRVAIRAALLPKLQLGKRRTEPQAQRGAIQIRRSVIVRGHLAQPRACIRAACGDEPSAVPRVWL